MERETVYDEGDAIEGTFSFFSLLLRTYKHQLGSFTAALVRTQQSVSLPTTIAEPLPDLIRVDGSSR